MLNKTVNDEETINLQNSINIYNKTMKNFSVVTSPLVGSFDGTDYKISDIIKKELTKIEKKIINQNPRKILLTAPLGKKELNFEIEIKEDFLSGIKTAELYFLEYYAIDDFEKELFKTFIKKYSEISGPNFFAHLKKEFNFHSEEDFKNIDPNNKELAPILFDLLNQKTNIMLDAIQKAETLDKEYLKQILFLLKKDPFGKLLVKDFLKEIKPEFKDCLMKYRQLRKLIDKLLNSYLKNNKFNPELRNAILNLRQQLIMKDKQIIQALNENKINIIKKSINELTKLKESMQFYF